MNSKKWLPLVAALALGTVALILMKGVTSRGPSSTKEATVRVVVAKEAIAPGQELRPEQMGLQQITAPSIPPNAFTDPAQLTGRVALAPMVAGQPILNELLAVQGAQAGLPALVPHGMRAMTIDVSETTGVAGMVAPGTRVDVVSILSAADHSKAVSKTIVGNVFVIAVGQRLSAAKPEGDTGGFRTVTLLVTPREAEKIDLATTSAHTRLLLRGTGDTSPADTEGVMFTELDGSGTTAATTQPSLVNVDTPATQPARLLATSPADTQVATLPAHHFRTVRVINGGNVSSVQFEVESEVDTHNDMRDAYPQ